MFGVSRNRKAQGEALVVWKVRVFAVGAAVALAGMALTLGWMVWAGIGVLAVGVALRAVGGRSG